MIRITSWFLLMMGSYPRGFQVPDMPGVVTAAHDERGEVGVVVVRAEAQRALAGLDADLDEKPGSCPDRIDRWAGRTSPGRDLAGAQ